jgi:hypothetical protein
MTRSVLRRSAPFLALLIAAACGSPAEKFDARAPAVPFVDQIHPAGRDANYDGSMNCGPAVVTGIAKGHGLTDGLDDAAAINLIVDVAGTNGEGTTGHGMIAALEFLGFSTNANPGCDLDWIDNELAAGHDVIALGDYYSIPGHDDPGLASGHYIAISGVRDNWTVYEVMDPAGKNVRSLTDDELQNFVDSDPQGGFTISAW